MGPTTLSDVQCANLNLLMAIHQGIQEDRLSTCCRFGVDTVLADRIKALSFQQIMAIVTNLGDAAMFPPRADLVALLDMPVALTRLLATVTN